MIESPTSPTTPVISSHSAPSTSGVTPPIKTPPHPPRPHRPIGLWRLIIGLFIILIGVSLLSNSMGWSWAFSIDIWKFWPVFVILAGVSMLFKKNSGWIIGLVVLIVIGLAAASTVNAPWNANRAVTTHDLNVTTDAAAKSADIRINTGASQLTIGGGSAQLLSGQQEFNFGQLDISSRLNGEEQIATLSSINSGGWWWFGSMKNNINLTMNNDLPAKLTIDGGAMTMNLDLITVPVSDLTVKSGASDVTLALGDKVDSTRARISAGASKLRVSLPKTVGVRLTVNAGASSKTLTDFTSLGDDRYESTNYATTEKKMDLDIEAGASTIDLSWR